MKMKTKINKQFLLVAGTAIFFTLVLSVAFFYQFFQTEVMANLKMDAYMLKNVVEEYSWKELKAQFIMDNFRETIIAEDGTVIFDSEADFGEMENHGKRPEIEQALLNGEGSDIRHSLTRGKSTFYFAVLLEDGSVLRIASEAGSLWQVYESVLPGVFVMVLVLFVLCILLSHFLTKSIVKPIEHLAKNLDQCDPADVYKELRPVIRTIQAQHEDILKNADMRQEFTANISHELKTPLTSISGYSELIETGMAADQDVIRFAGEIHRSSDRLLTLINDIIRLSELDVSADDPSGGYDPIDFYALAGDCVEMLSVSAKKHHVTMTLSGESCFLRADKSMLEELLYNLCDNAIRYNKDGGTVNVEIRREENGIRLVVEDTGIGIPKEHQERIFERFYRVDKSRSKQTGGTGLGLAIVKHIVAKQGASLELVSEEGKGTKITVFWK